MPLLKPHALTTILNQAIGGGVESVLLLKEDGALLAFSSDGAEMKDAQVSAAIASNIWGTYSAAEPPQPLRFVTIACESGQMVTTTVAGLLLCIIASETTGLGMIKAKAQALQAYLDAPLKKIFAASS